MVAIGEWCFRGGRYAGKTYEEVKEMDIKYLQRLAGLETFKYANALKNWLGDQYVPSVTKTNTICGNCLKKDKEIKRLNMLLKAKNFDDSDIQDSD